MPFAYLNMPIWIKCRTRFISYCLQSMIRGPDEVPADTVLGGFILQPSITHGSSTDRMADTSGHTQIYPCAQASVQLDTYSVS